MKKTYPSHRACVLLLLSLLTQVACLKGAFDQPPEQRNNDPGLNVTHTIAQLKQIPSYTKIEEEVTIAGIVVMNDRSGNYFRKLVLQDSSGGIELLVDANYLYHDYPLGRKIYVQCKGLFLGAFAENPQLGYTPDLSGRLTGIPPLLADDFIIKASYPHTLIPDTLSLIDLANTDLMQRYYNTLIVVRNVEFDSADMGMPYAAPVTVAPSTTYQIRDCIGRSILLKTSAQADFRTATLPAGNGTLGGIYTRNYQQGQMVIRDTTDLALNTARCNQTRRTLLFQDFSSLPEGDPVVLAGWSNVPEVGEKFFKKRSSTESSGFTRITAFGGGTPTLVRSWLILPGLDLSDKWNVWISYRIRDGYDNGAQIGLYVSPDYRDGERPANATWTELPVPVGRRSTTGYAEWTNVFRELPFHTPVRIAFLYKGGTGKTTTFDITDIKITSE